jgi:hypothetical protein
MKVRWTWKEGFRFALAGEFRTKSNFGLDYKMSRAEKLGSLFLRPLYKSIDWVSNYIRKPFVIILITLLAALITILIFYNIPAFFILGKIFPPKLIRFLLFFYLELQLFGMGCLALGRFNNQVLIDLWKKDQLVPIFPGDSQN